MKPEKVFIKLLKSARAGKPAYIRAMWNGKPTDLRTSEVRSFRISNGRQIIETANTIWVSEKGEK